ncbi:MAG: hypothetical protein DMG90_12360 [Acidobacteria bacterium]|nr:MAG: hypothetical protein DMG90_12360 [Acidobacteriota bacterium]
MCIFCAGLVIKALAKTHRNASRYVLHQLPQFCRVRTFGRTIGVGTVQDVLGFVFASEGANHVLIQLAGKYVNFNVSFLLKYVIGSAATSSTKPFS